MDQPTDLTKLIDEALERFSARGMVQASEIVDVLLDLRGAALEQDELAQLLAGEPEPEPA